MFFKLLQISSSKISKNLIRTSKLKKLSKHFQQSSSNFSKIVVQTFPKKLQTFLKKFFKLLQNSCSNFLKEVHQVSSKNVSQFLERRSHNISRETSPNFCEEFRQTSPNKFFKLLKIMLQFSPTI